MTKGYIKYVPKDLMKELEDVKFTFKILKDRDAFRIIANNSKLARELKFSLDFRDKGRKG